MKQLFDLEARRQQANQLRHQLQQLLDKPEAKDELVKLTRLRAQLQRAGHSRLFICLTANIACDNNRAERDLRP